MKKISKMIILSMFLVILTPFFAPTQQAHAYEYEYQAKVITDGSNLNVRSGPGTNYSIVGKLANGTIVTYSYISPVGWDYIWGIDINGKEISGYVSSAYLGAP